MRRIDALLEHPAEGRQIVARRRPPAPGASFEQGSITAEWKTSENNQRARVYRLTTNGRKQLAAARSRWEQFSGAMAGILRGPQEAKG